MTAYSENLIQYEEGAPTVPPSDGKSIWVDVNTSRVYLWDEKNENWIWINGALGGGEPIAGQFASDQAATTVSEGELYELSADNIYGLPEGVVKRKKSS